MGKYELKVNIDMDDVSVEEIKNNYSSDTVMNELALHMTNNIKDIAVHIEPLDGNIRTVLVLIDHDLENLSNVVKGLDRYADRVIGKNSSVDKSLRLVHGRIAIMIRDTINTLQRIRNSNKENEC